MSDSYQLNAAPVAGLPCLTLARAGAPPDAPVAVVLHGLGRQKEAMLPTLYAFARRGIRATALDARWHGERAGAADREARLGQDYIVAMSEIIRGTAEDVSHLVQTLGVTQAAIHGVSLGGYIAFAALADEPRLTVGSVAMGNPDWLEPLRALGLGPGDPPYDAIAPHSPLERAAMTFPPRSLLMLHGDQDERVPISGVQALVQRLKPFYKDTPERLQLVVYPGLGHIYTDDMMEYAARWVAHSLGAANPLLPGE